MALTQISTAGVKDDAVTSGKIPANAVGSSELADNAVDTAAIADDAVTAAKLASGVQTTINNNADNRIITGSGTANTLNGEANLTYDGNSFISTQTTSSSDSKVIIRNSNTPASGVLRLEFHHGTGSTEGTNRFRYGFIEGYRQSGSNDGGLAFGTKPNNAGAPTERMRIDSSGNVGIGTNNPDQKLKIEDSSDLAIHLLKTGSQDTLIKNTGQTEICAATGGASGQRIAFKIGANTGSLSDIAKFTPDGLCFGSDTATANALDDYEEGTYTPSVETTNNVTAGTSSTPQGTYIKIGRLVYVTFSINVNSFSGVNTSGYIRLYLPFTAANDGIGTEGNMFVSTFSIGTSNVSWMGGEVQNGFNFAYVHYHNGNNNNTNYMTGANANGSFNVRGTVLFRVP